MKALNITVLDIFLLLLADVSPPNISVVPDNESEEELIQKTQALLPEETYVLHSICILHACI